MEIKVDSDSEGSSDPEVSVQFSNVHTRSVFNITLDLPSDETKENNDRTDYEKRLNDEINDWLSLLKRTKQAISNSASTTKSVDYSVLSPEKLAYLKRAPDLTKFVEESVEFCYEAKVYLEVDYAEALELHEKLTEICNSLLDTSKSQLIEKYVFNGQKPHREIN